MRRFLIVFLALILPAVVRAELSDGIYATVDTSMGSFTCRLDYAEAPLTCANFMGLAEGSQSWIDPETAAVRTDPFYDGLIFHRVIDGFMIQGGCPLGTGGSGPGYAFPDETSTNLTHHSAGILSMANSGPNSNGSQFFITLAPTPWLDNAHSVFGEVVDGIGVVTNIGSVATTADRPDVDVVINQINILRIGPAAVAFDVSAQPLPVVTPSRLALTNAPGGLEIVAGLTNQTERLIHSSTNLSAWLPYEESYSSATVGQELVPVSTALPSMCFRAVNVYYPQAVTSFSNIDGRTLTFTQGTNVLVFAPEAGGTGSCDIAGTPDILTYWDEWTTEPYVGRVVFQPSSINAFQYHLELGGSCRGYQYMGGSNWQYIGLWELDIVPE